MTEPAARDLEAIVAVLAGESEAVARQCLGRLRQRAGSPERFPLRGRVVPELVPLGIDSRRELVVGPHQLIYRVAGCEVFALAVFDARRNLAELLFERLVRPD